MFSLQSDTQFCMKSAAALFWLVEDKSGLCLLGRPGALCAAWQLWISLLIWSLGMAQQSWDNWDNWDCTGFSQAVAPWPLEQLALIRFS